MKDIGARQVDMRLHGSVLVEANGSISREAVETCV